MKNVHRSVFVCTLVASLTVASNTSSFLCYLSSWEIRQCDAQITLEDGTINNVSFVPAKEGGRYTVLVPSCWLLGCHPAHCQNWRESIRAGCQQAWQQKHSFMWDIMAKKVTSAAFEGCAAYPAPASRSVLEIGDWSLRRVASRFLTVCSSDPDAEQWIMANVIARILFASWVMSTGFARRGVATTSSLCKPAITLVGVTIAKGSGQLNEMSNQVAGYLKGCVLAPSTTKNGDALREDEASQRTIDQEIPQLVERCTKKGAAALTALCSQLHTKRDSEAADESSANKRKAQLIALCTQFKMYLVSAILAELHTNTGEPAVSEGSLQGVDTILTLYQHLSSIERQKDEDDTT